MVKIRLARHGRKNNPFYRIVVIPSQSKREGKTLAVLGHWYPKKGVKKINKKELEAWVSKGAQVSEAVSKLIL